MTPSDRYRLYYCHALGIPPDRFGDPGWDPAQDPPRVSITTSLPEGTDTRIRLASPEFPADPRHGCFQRRSRTVGDSARTGQRASPVTARSE